ncbi:DUF2058 family protein [Luteibacter sp. 22Crub2.1]|uniref:DUF2058 family protein n=1 Tax=Luteibacter sp. 22Crub2.1 TaxID=1283288 RepID=UPI0009A667BC|nr:DUF2058 family protein [Luteibacter sp. 22Crub2.1]SKB61316.1 Uncharacterized conserved protein YaiL, DUF2058 family [Luteibacter sp. 22Crub2.1]
MAESLRDQLLKSGLVKEVREEKRASTPPPKQGGASGQPYAGNNPRHGGKPKQGQGGRPQGDRAGGGKGAGNNRPQDGRRGQAAGRPQNAKPARTDGEMDLARAYAIRAQTESAERRKAEAEAAEVARLRKEKKRKVEELLKGKALNLADADQVRHFPYGEKIRRVHVDAAQLTAINAGELGVVQQGGRYLVVDKAVVDALRELAPEFIALMVDPDAVSEADDGVPDDLMW